MNVIVIKGREAPRAERSTMETKLLTMEQMQAWRVPPFQRELRMNGKVRLLAERLKQDGGIIPGVITLGTIPNDKTIYLVDGQHRREGFAISELKEGIADVRLCHFKNSADMAREYVKLNSYLVKMRPDDILRGLEGSVRALHIIRQACEFVGYGQVRRGSKGSPILSMSALLRCWQGSSGETPTASTKAALDLAEEMEESSALEATVFLQVARSAWGADPEYYRLWSNLNLTVSMWLWRRLVVDKDRRLKRHVMLTPEQFRKCLMAMSANSDYMDWLLGRQMNDRDRSPCYLRMKNIFQHRLMEEGKVRDKKMVQMPSPAWSSNK